MRKAYYVACGLVYELDVSGSTGARRACLLADWLSLPLYIARLCDVEIQESGALSAADGLLVLMVMAVFAMGSLSVYAVSLGLTVRRRSKQAA